MKRLCLLLLVIACVVVGCKKEQPKVELNVPGVNLKVNEQGGTINVTQPGK